MSKLCRSCEDEISQARIAALWPKEPLYCTRCQSLADVEAFVPDNALAISGEIEDRTSSIELGWGVCESRRVIAKSVKRQRAIA